ncbi:MAG TPA: alpha/beta hydrolase [Intrasporangium sp.]|nr:alpha/beta hydrolase [Intrasporangium sp.]
MIAVDEARFSTGVPYLRLGQGPPLLMASGLTSEHTNPTGAWRRMSLAWAHPFAEHFTVYLANRKPGLAPGATMADIAADYAGAIEHDIGQPVLLHGTSTGGSVALQLAIDRPELIQRMVVSAAACRLSPHGREVMAQVARLTREGDARRATALMFGTGMLPALAYVARGLGWAMGGGFAVDNPSDMLTTIAAEDSFDAEPGLPRVQAPTLVLGGTADRFYSSDLFRRTAAGIPHGRAVLLPGKSHVHVAGSKVPAGIALGFLIGGSDPE